MGPGGHRKSLKLGVVVRTCPANDGEAEAGRSQTQNLLCPQNKYKPSYDVTPLEAGDRMASNERATWTTQRAPPATQPRTWRVLQTWLTSANDSSLSPGFNAEHRAKLNKVLTFPSNFLSS